MIWRTTHSSKSRNINHFNIVGSRKNEWRKIKMSKEKRKKGGFFHINTGLTTCKRFSLVVNSGVHYYRIEMTSSLDSLPLIGARLSRISRNTTPTIDFFSVIIIFFFFYYTGYTYNGTSFWSVSAPLLFVNYDKYDN